MGVGSPPPCCRCVGGTQPSLHAAWCGGGELSIPATWGGGGGRVILPCCVLWGWGALPPLPVLGIRLRTMHETEIIPFSSLARAAEAQTLAGTTPVPGKGPRGGSGVRLSPGAPTDKSLDRAVHLLIPGPGRFQTPSVRLPTRKGRRWGEVGERQITERAICSRQHEQTMPDSPEGSLGPSGECTPQPLHASRAFK